MYQQVLVSWTSITRQVLGGVLHMVFYINGKRYQMIVNVGSGGEILIPLESYPPKSRVYNDVTSGKIPPHKNSYSS